MHAHLYPREFNELVNMTADELKEWLGSQESESAGWTNSSSSNGETVGHESGRRIVSILSKNPHKDPSKYDVSPVFDRRVLALHAMTNLLLLRL